MPSTHGQADVGRSERGPQTPSGLGEGLSGVGDGGPLSAPPTYPSSLTCDTICGLWGPRPAVEAAFYPLIPPDGSQKHTGAPELARTPQHSPASHSGEISAAAIPAPFDLALPATTQLLCPQVQSPRVVPPYRRVCINCRGPPACDYVRACGLALEGSAGPGSPEKSPLPVFMRTGTLIRWSFERRGRWAVKGALGLSEGVVFCSGNVLNWGALVTCRRVQSLAFEGKQPRNLSWPTLTDQSTG